MENKSELIEKAKQAKSPEELLAFAKENEIELTEDEAKAYFEQLNKLGELSDDELDNVAGGGCYKDDYLVVTPTYGCKEWRCWKCKAPKDELPYTCYDGTHWVACASHSSHCKDCTFYGEKSGLLICTNPLKKKK